MEATSKSGRRSLVFVKIGTPQGHRDGDKRFLVFSFLIGRSRFRITVGVLSPCCMIQSYFQHVHFIPVVGVGKERRTLIGPW